MAIAPYQVIITPVNVREESLAKASEALYQKLQGQGIEVLLDDRDERAGVKFMDADLIGIPIRITIGPKNLAEKKVEIKIRRSGEVKILGLAEVEAFIVNTIKEEM
jgi:prolyl-tRNA synthetase